MKRNAFTLFFLISIGCLFLESCSTYIKLVECEAIDSKMDGAKNVVYENDTFRVEYNIWGPGGIMYYRVYNKLSVPLYVNWFKSAYLKWDTKYNYTGNYRDVAFIPPHSYVENPVAYILLRDQSVASYVSTSGGNTVIENVDIRNDVNAAKEKVDKTWKKSGQTTIYSKTYNRSNTPLAFRNFITLSICENADECTNLKNFIFIEHSFYVTKMTEMDTRQFNGKGTQTKMYVKRGNKMVRMNSINWAYPYRSGNRFYIPLAF